MKHFGLRSQLAVVALLLLRCDPAVPATRPVVLPPKVVSSPVLYGQFDPEQHYAFTAVVALQAPSFAPTGIIDCPQLSDAARVQIQTAYVEALQSGLQSVLLAHGYTLTGPFADREQMTYGEKEKAILLIQPRVTFACTCESLNETIFSQGTEDAGTVRGKPVGAVPVGGVVVPIAPKLDLVKHRTIVRINGQARVRTRLELAMVEPVTGEKMWLKALETALEAKPYEYYEERDAFEVTWPPLYRGPYDNPTAFILEGYDARLNVIAMALAGIRRQQLRQFEQYVAPAEITQVIADAQKVRQLKRY